MTRLRDLIRHQPKLGFSMPLRLDRLLSVGIVSADPQVARRQRCTNAAAYASVVSGISYIALTSFYDLLGLLPLNIYNALLVVIGIVLPFWHRLGENFVAIALVSFICVGQLYVVWMLGLSSELHVFYLLGGASLFFFGIQNWKLFLGFFACMALLLVCALNFAPVDGLLLPTDGRLRDLVSSQTLLSVLLINAAIIFYVNPTLGIITITMSASSDASRPITGRLPRSRSPPAPTTEITRPPRTRSRAARKTFSSAPGLCA